jgi:hypothetical protein
MSSKIRAISRPKDDEVVFSGDAFNWWPPLKAREGLERGGMIHLVDDGERVRED